MALTLFISEDKRDEFAETVWPFDSLLEHTNQQGFVKTCIGGLRLILLSNCPPPLPPAASEGQREIYSCPKRSSWSSGDLVKIRVGDSWWTSLVH